MNLNQTTPRWALEAHIALLEEALAEYAHRYGMTERARAAFRAGAPKRMDGGAEALDDGEAPGQET